MQNKEVELQLEDLKNEVAKWKKQVRDLELTQTVSTGHGCEWQEVEELQS